MGAALAVVVFGAAFGISRVLSGGGAAHAAKRASHATVATAPAPDPALAADFSGQPVSLKLPPAPRQHAHKAVKHDAGAASTAASGSSAGSASASTQSSPSTSAPVQSAAVDGSSGGGSSGSTPTHHSPHHRSGGSGHGTTTIP